MFTNNITVVNVENESLRIRDVLNTLFIVLNLEGKAARDFFLNQRKQGGLDIYF